jgi:hypothetical protein
MSCASRRKEKESAEGDLFKEEREEDANRRQKVSPRANDLSWISKPAGQRFRHI